LTKSYQSDCGTASRLSEATSFGKADSRAASLWQAFQPARLSQTCKLWLNRPMENTSYRAFFILLALLLSVPPILNAFRFRDTKDYTLWYDVGQRVLHGESLYPVDGSEFPFLYPTLPAVLCAPLSLFSFPVFVGILALANGLAWWGSIVYSVRLATGKTTGQPVFLYLIPTIVSLPFVWDTYLLGQVNIVLLFMLLASFVALRENGPVKAGLWISLAAAIKAFPIMAAGWLVWRRQWRALAGMLAGLGLFLLVLPGCVRGFEYNLREMTTWFQGMVGRQSAVELGQRSEISFSYRNQSLKSVTHRLLRPVIAGDVKGETFTVNVLSLSPVAAEVVFWGIGLVMCLAFVLKMRRMNPADPGNRALEQAMLLCLIVLFSPLAWTYFYCWLLFPVTVAANSLFGMEPGPRRRWLGALALAALLVMASALTQAFNFQWTQAVGATAWGAVLMFTLLALLGSAPEHRGNVCRESI